MLFATAALSLAVRLLLTVPVSQVEAIPLASHTNITSSSSSSYWLSSIQRQGTVAFGTSGYKVYRSVADYGAKGKLHRAMIPCLWSFANI